MSICGFLFCCICLEYNVKMHKLYVFLLNLNYRNWWKALISVSNIASIWMYCGIHVDTVGTDIMLKNAAEKQMLTLKNAVAAWSL